MRTLEPQPSAKHKGHFALFNCSVLGHTASQWSSAGLYSHLFPKKTFYSCHRMDLVMIRPPGIETGAFMVSPDSTGLTPISAAAMLCKHRHRIEVIRLCTGLDARKLWGDYGHNGHYCCYCIFEIVILIIAIVVIIDYCHYLLFDRMVGVDRL